MGVDMDCIINDYLLTNEYLKKRIEETIVKFQSLHIDEAIIQETKKYFFGAGKSFETIFPNNFRSLWGFSNLSEKDRDR